MYKKDQHPVTNTYDPAVCPVARTLQIIGGKWKPLILYLVSEDMNRFSKLSRCLPGISKHMLTQQLRELESDGILTRTAYPEVPPRVEYALTDKGRSLRIITMAILQWGQEHL
ncbi:winged helix-turn-helix transcriptional regulator [Chitinophaga japonensis]|uniref:HxlR family transcriptional regulator n=1 Tax=Chitinophaga japonensis TaxID=104662 RepID=A0A562T5G3_CHIJA|nr:helix-turn-helix domain-containing protein [Chitinophaga japonensis]TWI88781.1 HxlR family transcriptional regulator [Chitinophaga japonensis]